MPQNSASLTRNFSQLAHIATVLPAYASRFTGPEYGWLTPEYIQSKTAPAQQFFAQAAELTVAVSALAARTAETRANLARLVSALRFQSKASSLFTDDTAWEEQLVAPSSDLLARAEYFSQLLARVAGRESTASSYLDVARLQRDLNEALAAYIAAKNELEGQKNALTTEQREYVQYEDAVSDLWHTVTNALDGLFHEEREILYAFMPWRRKTSNTAATASTVEPATEPTPQP